MSKNKLHIPSVAYPIDRQVLLVIAEMLQNRVTLTNCKLGLPNFP